MSDRVKELTDESFSSALSDGVSLVDFWAPWCGPCRIQGQILDSLADRVGDSATVAKVNIDEASDVAATFGVRSIPTIIIFKDGDVVQKFVGIQNEHVLMGAIEEAKN